MTPLEIAQCILLAVVTVGLLHGAYNLGARRRERRDIALLRCELVVLRAQLEASMARLGAEVQHAAHEARARWKREAS